MKIKIDKQDLVYWLCYVAFAIAVGLLMSSCSTLKKASSKTKQAVKIKEEKIKDSSFTKKTDSITATVKRNFNIDTSEILTETNTVIEEQTDFVNDSVKRVTKKTTIQKKQNKKTGAIHQNKVEKNTSVSKTDAGQIKTSETKDSTATVKQIIKEKKKISPSLWLYLLLIPALVLVFRYRRQIYKDITT